LTTYFTNHSQPQRSFINNGHPLLGAPYGLYATSDGYMALAMMDIGSLAKAIDCKPLEEFSKEQAFASRDKIKMIIAAHVSSRPTVYWLTHLQAAGLWAMEVLDWEKMIAHEAYRSLQMEQTINTAGKKIVTTRCPIRLNRQPLFSDKPAPVLGEHTEQVYREFIN
jgi:crotonobetainyl-CoA:carnitine CoA-transferase CaiB-like acyl-CoA transferase